MAQHIEIPKTPFALIFEQVNPEPFRDNKEFERVPFKLNNKTKGKIYLNSRDYNERQGSLLGDEYVLTLDLKNEVGSFEIHFNYRNKINKVYYVI